MTATTVTSLIRLAPGEALHLPLDARTILQVQSGTLVLREPLRWLADTVVAPAALLCEGHCHRVAHAGWVELQAGQGGAQVLSHRTLTAWQALWQRLWTRSAAVELGEGGYSARPMSATANTATPIARFIATM